MKIFHDSRNESYRLPGGAMPAGGRVLLGVFAPEAKCATLRIWWQDAEVKYPMNSCGDGMFRREIELPTETGTFWYYFLLDGRVFYGNAPDGLGGEGQVCGHEPPSFQITIYDPDAMKTPAWMKRAVLYQVFPDRFASSGKNRPLPPGGWKHDDWHDIPSSEESENGDCAALDFFGGDFKGIEGKLDYIASLGATVIYLNPIFRSASNHRYNTGDYRVTDPALGSEAEFSSLCRAARERGIRVILDGVFSHTGSDSAYFNRQGHYGRGGAYRAKKSKYASWYSFREWPDDYDCWWGFDTLPCVNELDPGYADFIAGENGIVEKWLRAGASGWRLDVADELPMEFIRRIRRRIKSVDPDAALIGEVWEDPTNKIAYGTLRNYMTGDSLDAVMNYPLREAIIAFLTFQTDGCGFVRRVLSLRENLPREAFYAQMNLLGSHDRARIISVLSGAGNMEPDRRYRYPVQHSPEEYARGRARFLLAWQILCALPGMPSLYYGDEAGLTGMNDPYNRGTFPWGREDGELTGKVREAIARRNASRALQEGELDVSSPAPDLVLIVRTEGGAAETLAVNRGREDLIVRDMQIPGESAVWLD